MDELSHYDLFSVFTLKEAACLAAGIEPKGNQLTPRAAVILEAMENSLNFWRCDLPTHLGVEKLSDRPFEWNVPGWVLVPNDFALEFNRDRDQALTYAEVREYVERAMQTYRDRPASLLLNRHELARWFAAKGAGFVPSYTFRPLAQDATTLCALADSQSAIEVDSDRVIDPSDLPDELHAANIAFRAVSNGHGDPSATFKNRLIAYLRENFEDLSAEAVARIATVANPDKSPGRKTRSPE